MGAWGSGPFENDSACDWLMELEQATDYSFIKGVFVAVLEPTVETPDLPPYEEALAAAEVIAASHGRAMADAPEEIQVWVTKMGPAPTDLTALALRTITTIKVESELRDRWAETDSLKTWTATVDGLAARCSS